MHPVLQHFHPVVAAWFAQTFAAPTPAQVAAWPAIQAGRHTLVAAPTGSGKTLTAFFAAIDALIRDGLDNGGALPDQTRVVYVSPLKALSNDIHLNLEAPLQGIRAALVADGLPDVAVRTAVRTGDTPQRERAQARRVPPHILVTTPESLYVLLGSASGRSALRHVRTVIVDEIHAVAADKRGSHLSLTLERLQRLADQPITRVGLSATQKPIETVAQFLVGVGEDGAPPPCEIVDIGYTRERDLALALPPTPLSVVMSNDQWLQVYADVAALAQQHRTTLVFVNTRRMAERAARHLGDLLGKQRVAAHHGSLSRETRLLAEQRLKAGELTVLVATASLELGLDIGDVDLVCQLGSPRSIATFLQRAGRSGHKVGGTPKARLFPQTRDELVECAALLDGIRRGELDALRIPLAPVDVLAQQIVAEAACEDWDEDALFTLMRRAWPFAQLSRATFDSVVRMLCEGFSTRLGPRAGYLHRDAVHRRLHARRGARMTALTSGGTIPETGDYSVVLEPQAEKIGTVNEDFAVESLTGDVFQLGNASYRILRVDAGRVRVEDAKGAPPNIPFWLGEAPGRSDELSAAVSRLRSEIAARLDHAPHQAARDWLCSALGCCAEAAQQLVDYLAHASTALGAMPTQQCLVMERFFDASGGTQLVIHSPYGSRINRAWGLALRKRFCRTFNFELQAAATEDAIVLSLSTSHSFALEEVGRYLHSSSAEHVLIQALLDAPLFGVRWRWNATNAMALPRFTGGNKVAPQLQRMKSEDLLATVFPDQVACAENLVGEREVPDHPLVTQTLDDCLHQAMDSEGWLEVLRGLESGAITLVARDLAAPSPLAAEALNARPYAFLDDAPLEERRTQAVQSRRYTPQNSDDLGRLDPQAITSVREEAWPQPRDAEEMHETLVGLGVLPADEATDPQWQAWLSVLAADGRASCLLMHGVPALWISAERIDWFMRLYPHASAQPLLHAPDDCRVTAWKRDSAVRELLRGRLSAVGPAQVSALTAALRLPEDEIALALLALQREGYVMAGQFSAHAPSEEWCERHLLARIHRYTLGRLRREIEPVSQRDYARFLFEWQHLDSASRVAGPDALAGVVEQLEGFEAPAVLWESEVLPARVRDYQPAWLDELCTAGRTTWARLRPGGGRSGAALRATPIVLLPRREAQRWSGLARAADDAPLGSRAQRVVEVLQQQGALFFDEIADAARLMSTELEDALSELVMRGRAHCDSYAGLRALLVPASKRPSALSRQRRRAGALGIRDAGRWAPVRALAELPLAEAGERQQEMLEHVARTLLRRYGVVCWRLLEREAAWLPPWRELLRMYQRLEARGEIRGGRFIAGLSGEQFALPDAIAALRRVRAQPPQQRWVCVSASDPSNLLGSVLPGERVARVPGNRVASLDGLPMAVWSADRFLPLQELTVEQTDQALRILQRGPGAAEPTPMEQWLAQSPESAARAPITRGSGRDK
ncbi:ATP-dependent DNA helicase [Xanthomonas vesicatoria ATCC 35937]|uniref:ATP dependent helicase, Lhr family n=1 Tax=Xanthomonas vesicatoria ATCC 35937 TaxID=925775 RepID=F0BA68_9XANT|nr:DEAD/DEAH box helicase [Xanthomonas vesicatoria]APP74429.1 ATP-dependent DNA helicase [Xanthomonas vesicatoria ATCC 35937]EGD10670.1 ATP dependent helicase, Lhr family [Xanthomonas vesicatoria ATCC 35937]KTF31664.1 ATP-dependent DNA helicase [Xanthomonas vesicatoria]MCC8598233.1 DEAD/DEAH box helicase [Xanthomonas vesicatoria]MCC8607624.1 DEAD/DEAH box helicase [Xanthomonas vesicatoria]